MKTRATITRTKKSELMTQFLRDFERFTGRRVTVELMRSPEWISARDTYVSLFLPLMADKSQTEKGN